MDLNVCVIHGHTLGSGPKRIRSSKLGLFTNSQDMKAPNFRESTTGELSRAMKSVSTHRT